MACEKVFLERLRERGLRLTPQREMVLAVMHELEGLATAEEVYEQVRTQTLAVDISTVYRTLDLLQRLGIVACLNSPTDGQYRYELLGVHGPHIHLVCRSCGAVLGVALDEAEAFAEKLETTHGFVADVDHLSIEGLCHECAKRMQEAAESD